MYLVQKWVLQELVLMLAGLKKNVRLDRQVNRAIRLVRHDLPWERAINTGRKAGVAACGR